MADEAPVVPTENPGVVLVNQESGLAELLPQEQADEALNNQTHEIPLNDPQGNPITAPLHQAQEFVGSGGYSQPNPEQLSSLLKYSKHSSLSEKAKTLSEGAAESLTFGLSTGAERLMGVDPKDIQARREVNKGTHMAGQALGLAASMMTGTGEAALVSGAGKAATRALGLGKAATALGQAESSYLSHMGAYAIQSAVETGLVSTGDEISKMFSQDPHQTVETAIANIGLNALFAGATSPLYSIPKSGMNVLRESKLGQAMGDFKSQIAELLQNPEAAETLAPSAWAEIKETLKKKGITGIGGEIAGATAGAIGAHALGMGILGSTIFEISGATLGGIAGHAMGKDGSVVGGIIKSMLPSFYKPLVQQTVNSEAFKSAVELGMFAKNTQDVVAPIIKGLFWGAGNVLPQLKNVQAPAQREKLKEAVEDYKVTPENFTHVAENIGYYLPDQAVAMGSLVSRAMEYLGNLAPHTDPQGPLDSKRIPNMPEIAKYHQALDIANQPLTVIQKIKDGSLQPSDVQTFKTIYPSLYDSVSQNILNEMIDFVSKKNSVPYGTRMALSLFLGQPLDSTMTPQAIQAAQPKGPVQAQNAPPQPGAPKKSGSMAQLGKMTSLFPTSSQARLLSTNKYTL